MQEKPGPRAEKKHWAQRYLDLAEVILLALDAQGRVTFINRKGCRILGYEEPDVVGKNWFETFLPKDIREQVRAVFLKLMAGEVAPIEYYENPVLHRAGDLRIIAWHNAVLTDEEGKILGAISSGEDITERRRSEQLLKDRETRLLNVLDNMVDGLITIDEKGIIETFNRAAERLFGYTAEEVVGQNVRVLMPEPYRGEHDAYIRNYLRTGEAKIIGIGREVEGKRKDGTTFPLSLAVSEMRLGEKRMFVGNLRDISHERQLREQLFQSEKLSTIGELAAGIAHEIGGPLSVISGNAEFLKESFRTDDLRKKDVEGVIEGCDAVAGFLRRLLDFSRPARLEFHPVDLNESLRNIFSLVRKQVAKEKIEVKLDLQVGLPRVLGDSNQLEQIFMNLVLNARNAMPEGGQLTISSYFSDSRSGRKERCVFVEFTDTGVGIPEENLERIFEPYFTTRKPGKGTGLGLAISRRIVNEHKGTLSVRSRVGLGSTFTIELPAMPEETH